MDLSDWDSEPEGFRKAVECLRISLSGSARFRNTRIKYKYHFAIICMKRKCRLGDDLATESSQVCYV